MERLTLKEYENILKKRPDDIKVGDKWLGKEYPAPNYGDMIYWFECKGRIPIAENDVSLSISLMVGILSETV